MRVSALQGQGHFMSSLVQVEAVLSSLSLMDWADWAVAEGAAKFSCQIQQRSLNCSDGRAGH